MDKKKQKKQSCSIINIVITRDLWYNQNKTLQDLQLYGNIKSIIFPITAQVFSSFLKHWLGLDMCNV